MGSAAAAKSDYPIAEAPAPHPPAYVYPWPVRAWHWITALAIFVLASTGYLIGSPPFSLTGEASQHFAFGWLRLLHLCAGETVAVAMVARIYWAIADGPQGRSIFYIPVWDVRFWRSALDELRWYFYLGKRPYNGAGHNPLARIQMVGYTYLLIGMIFSGLALHGETKGLDSWASRGFGWALGLVGGSQPLRTMHHLGMWLILTFVLVHLYAALRADIVGGRTIMSTMVNGWRIWKSPDQRTGKRP